MRQHRALMVLALVAGSASAALAQQPATPAAPPEPRAAPAPPAPPEPPMDEFADGFGADDFAGPGMMARPRAFTPERALRMKEQLKLSDAQVKQLEAIRVEAVKDRQAHAQRMIDAQSRIAAGLAKREDFRREFEQARDATHKAFDDRQDRMKKILTDEQRDQLASSIRRAQHQRMRPGMRMRPGAGRGMRMQRMPRN